MENFFLFVAIIAFIVLITLIICSKLQSNKFNEAPKSGKSKKSFQNFIYNYSVIIYWLLEIPIVLTIMFSQLDIDYKIYVFVMLIFPHCLMFFINAGICVYLIIADFNGAWGIISTIVASIVLLLYIITLITSYLISIKRDNRTLNNKYLATLILAIILVTSFSSYKVYDNFNTGIQYYNNTTIKLVSITEHVSPGETAYIKIKSTPNDEHAISVTYSSGTSAADGLYNKLSDESGYVYWSWKIGTNTAEGNYPITIYNLNTLESEEFYFTVQ